MLPNCVSFEFIIDLEKCSRFASLIRNLALFLYFYIMPIGFFVCKVVAVYAIFQYRHCTNQVVAWFLLF